MFDNYLTPELCSQIDDVLNSVNTHQVIPINNPKYKQAIDVLVKGKYIEVLPHGTCLLTSDGEDIMKHGGMTYIVLHGNPLLTRKDFETFNTGNDALDRLLETLDYIYIMRELPDTERHKKSIPVADKAFLYYNNGYGIFLNKLGLYFLETKGSLKNGLPKDLYDRVMKLITEEELKPVKISACPLIPKFGTPEFEQWEESPEVKARTNAIRRRLDEESKKIQEQRQQALHPSPKPSPEPAHIEEPKPSNMPIYILAAMLIGIIIFAVYVLLH